jgi:hypothetical protein
MIRLLRSVAWLLGMLAFMYMAMWIAYPLLGIRMEGASPVFLALVLAVAAFPFFVAARALDRRRTGNASKSRR